MRRFLSLDQGLAKSFIVTADDVAPSATFSFLKVEIGSITYTSPSTFTIKSLNSPNALVYLSLNIQAPWITGATLSIGYGSNPAIIVSNFNLDSQAKLVLPICDFDINDSLIATINHNSSPTGSLKFLLLGLW